MFGDIQAAYNALSRGRPSTKPAAAQRPHQAGGFDSGRRRSTRRSTTRRRGILSTGTRISTRPRASARRSGRRRRGRRRSGRRRSGRRRSGRRRSGRRRSGRRRSGRRRSGRRRSGRRRSGRRRSGRATSQTIRSSSRRLRPRACSQSRPRSSTTPEFHSRQHLERRADIYLRVQGRNGLFDSSHPFTLKTKRIGDSSLGVAPVTGPAPVVAGTTGTTKTIILTDSNRLNLQTSSASHPD